MSHCKNLIVKTSNVVNIDRLIEKLEQCKQLAENLQAKRPAAVAEDSDENSVAGIGNKIKSKICSKKEVKNSILTKNIVEKCENSKNCDENDANLDSFLENNIENGEETTKSDQFGQILNNSDQQTDEIIPQENSIPLAATLISDQNFRPNSIPVETSTTLNVTFSSKTRISAEQTFVQRKNSSSSNKDDSSSSPKNLHRNDSPSSTNLHKDATPLTKNDSETAEVTSSKRSHVTSAKSRYDDKAGTPVVAADKNDVIIDKGDVIVYDDKQSDDDVTIVKYENETQIADIMRLITRDLSEPYSIYTYRYFIHNWPYLCFLAKAGDDNGTITYIGAIVCKLSLHERGTRRGYIAMLAVDENFRRRKIGTRLVTQAIETMIVEGCDEVVLETEVTNKSAMKLYENLGFVRDKRLFRYYLNGVDAFRLKLWLRPPELVQYL